MEKPEVPWKRLVQMSLCPSQIPHGLAWDLT